VSAVVIVSVSSDLVFCVISAALITLFSSKKRCL